MSAPAIDIVLGLNDQASAGVNAALKNIEGRATGVSTALKGAAIAFAGVVSIDRVLTFGDACVDASAKAESLKTRLEILSGSQGEANRIFQEAEEYAGRVPFTFDEVMASATQLTGVTEGTAEAVMGWLPLIGDLAAVAGLTIEEATGQVVRMMSAGAASADLFRERGILAMLGFQAGVSYSAEETTAKLRNEWEKQGSSFRGATDKMSQDWDGLVSMQEDAWARIEKATGNMITQSPAVQAALKGITEETDKLGKELQESAPVTAEAVNLILHAFMAGGGAALVFATSWNGLEMAFHLSVGGIVKGAAAVIGAWASVNEAFGEYGNDTSGMRQAQADLELVGKVSDDFLKEELQEQKALEQRMGALFLSIAKIQEAVKAAKSEFYGGFDPLGPGAAGEKGAKKPPREGAPDKKEKPKKEEEYLDFWQRQEKDKYEVMSNSAQAIGDLRAAEEAEGVAAAEGVYGAWEYQARERERLEEEGTQGYYERLQEEEAAAIKAAEGVAGAWEHQAKDREALQERSTQLLYESQENFWRNQFDAADNYYSALEARMHVWAEDHQLTAQSVAEDFVSGMTTAVDAVSDRTMAAIIYEQNLANAFSDTMKGLLVQLGSYLMKTAIQYVITSIMKTKAAASEASAKIAGYSAETYAAAFASTVGFLTPVGAAGYASAATGMMLTGATGAYGLGMAAMQGVTGIGQADQGMIVPRTGSYLMNLEQGEVFIPRSAGGSLQTTEKGLPSMPRTTGGGAAATSGRPEVIQIHTTLNLPDGHVFGKFMAEVVLSGQARSGNYALEAKRVA